MSERGKGPGRDKPEKPEHPAKPEKPEHPEVIDVVAKKDQVAVLAMAGTQFIVGTVVRMGKDSITLKKAVTLQFDNNSEMYYVAYPLSYPLVSPKVAEAKHNIHTAYAPSVSLFDADSGHYFIDKYDAFWTPEEEESIPEEEEPIPEENPDDPGEGGEETGPPPESGGEVPGPT